jgi:tripartite ATP-independent transporter DctM subunit
MLNLQLIRAKELDMTIFIFIGSLLALMALGMPIAFALLGCGIALMLHLDMFDAQIIAQNVIAGADSFPLMAVPFFMLAGEVMNAGGLSKRIVAVALGLVGHIKGGLGYVTIVAACILSALSGSAVADAAALSALLVPMMVSAGHDQKQSAGLVAAAGVIGPIIPPSIGFVIFGVAANLSITKLFLAGIFPGLLVGLSLWITWWWLIRKENIQPPPKIPFSEVAKSLVDGFWALMLPLIIIFGLKLGVFTPTEASVVAAVYAIFVATFIYRELKLTQLMELFSRAAQTTAIVMFLVAAAMVSAWLITVADLPSKVVDLLEPFMGNQILLMFAIMILVVIVGTAMDMIPTILILTPVLVPVVKQAGIDPIYFGVLFIINNSIGLITPPVGTVLNVVAGVTKTSMSDLMKGVMPFLIAELVILLVMVLFPSLVTVPMRWFY